MYLLYYILQFYQILSLPNSIGTALSIEVNFGDTDILIFRSIKCLSIDPGIIYVLDKFCIFKNTEPTYFLIFLNVLFVTTVNEVVPFLPPSLCYSLRSIPSFNLFGMLQNHIALKSAVSSRHCVKPSSTICLQ